MTDTAGIGALLSSEDVDVLRALQSRARRVRGGTPVDSPCRAASEELSRRLAEYVDQGVPMGVLSRILGITRRAISARLISHGYRPGQPNRYYLPGSFRPPPGQAPADITGQRFGRLVAIAPTGEKRAGGYVWLLHCDCGGKLSTTVAEARRGKAKSCGCSRRKKREESR